ncbi:transcription-repair coupling factor [Coraliomargarita sp. W4R72]
MPKKRTAKSVTPTLYHGVCTEARAPLLYSLAQSADTELTLALVADPRRAQELAAEVDRYVEWSAEDPPLEVLHFPEDPPPDIDAQRRADRICDRLVVLSALLATPPAKRLLIATPEALLGACPTQANFAQRRLTLEVGQSHPFSELIDKLTTELDYDSEALCEQPGQIATRGGLIDIYPYDAHCPYRIDFFGDEIESIRSFDPTTQRTQDDAPAIHIAAADSGQSDSNSEASAAGALLGYLPADAVQWALEDPATLVREHPYRFEQLPIPRSDVTPVTSPSATQDAARAASLQETDSRSDVTPVTSPSTTQDAARAASRQKTDSRSDVTPVTSLSATQDAARAASLQTTDSRSDVTPVTSVRSFYQVLALRAHGDGLTGICALDTDSELFRTAERIEISSEPSSNYRFHTEHAQIGYDRFESEQSARLKFEKQIADWSRKGLAITFATAGESETKRIKELLADNPKTARLKPRFIHGTLSGGFIFRNSPGYQSPIKTGKNGLVLITDTEYFGRRSRKVNRREERARPTISQVDQLLDFTELADGDPLVHLQHGVCLFRGVTKLEIQGGSKEVISVEFAEQMTVHVPLQESHLLTRYVGLTKSSPKLAKVGGATWDKTRAAAERATLDYAAEMLQLHAQRSQAGGYAFPPDHPWQKDFEAAFPFKETPDQLTAIEATKQDMENEQAMDRLICGDVGFGKTEVAIRAALKAVLAGKQVAMLVPTTVLCQQHFNTFCERMAQYPIIVDMISRFRSTKQNKESISQLASGKIDIVIGTHRLLSQDVHFQDLGLLVVDEEQRFGVKQKERIKQLRADVDILTLSATPIPRTLYLAMAGARAMSVIETPPVDRRPIETIVKSYDEKLIKSAIQAETDRGGQVFYLHNRVDSIQGVAAKIEAMHPKLKVAVGHGQMTEGALEKVMTKFVAGKFDVLVCTTIIESGIDIPNCNTLIIEGADRFGLAQLYQIRGRVGRFKRQAYAYLLLHRHAALVEQAQKRLNALKQHNQLGAGFRIAMRDLELRGAGNLLGSQQSGHIAGIGFELYCQLLKQSVARLKGEPGADRIRAEVKLDFITTGVGGSRARSTSGTFSFAAIKDAEYGNRKGGLIEAALPSEYIAEPRLRIDFYRRLALAEKQEDIQNIAEELADRFGKRPLPTEALIAVSHVRVLAELAGVRRVETEGDRLICKLAIPSKSGEFLKSGSRFPRLKAKDPIKRLAEIQRFLKNKKQ